MPDISVSIGGSNAGLQQVLNDTVKRLGGLHSSATSALAPLMKLAAPVIGLVGLGEGIKGITEAIKGTLDKGRDLQNLMQRTGQNATSVLKLQSAFRAVRLDSDQVGPSINRLQKALAGVNDDGEDTSSVFAQLGIDVADLKTQDAAGQFSHLGQMILDLKDPAERTSAVMKIFGKSGGEMLQLFNNSAQVFGLLGSKLTGSQSLLAQNAAAYTRITTLLDQFIFKARSGFGFFAGLTAGLAPLLDRLTNLLPNIDLTEIGKQIGAIPGLLINAFQTGHLGELLSLAFQVAMAKAGQLLVSLAPMFAAAFSAVTPAMGDSFWGGMLGGVISFTNFLWGALASVMGGAISLIVNSISAAGTSFKIIKDGIVLIGATLMKAFEKPVVALRAGMEAAADALLAKLSKIPGAAKLLGLQHFQPAGYSALQKMNGAQREASVDARAESLGRPAIDNLTKDTRDLWSETKRPFTDFGHIAYETATNDKEGIPHNLWGLRGSDDKAAKGTLPASAALDALVTQLTAGMGQIAGQIAPPQGTDSLQTSGKVDKKKGKTDDSMEDEKAEIAILKAKSDGHMELASKLQRELDIKREQARLEAAGASPADAKKLATDKVDLSAKSDKQSTSDEDDQSKKFKPAPVRASSLASIGGGGYSRGSSLGSIQTVAQAMAASLKRLVEQNEHKDKSEQGPLGHLTAGASNSTAMTLG